MDDAMLAKRFGLIEQRLEALYEQLGIADGASDGAETTGSPSSGLPAEVIEPAQTGHEAPPLTGPTAER